MNAIKQPRHGNGRFQWSFGGWFGASLGSSVWMLLVGFFLLNHGQPTLSLIPWGCFVISAGAATALWFSRDRLLPFPALLTEFGILAMLYPITWFAVDRWALPQTLEAMNWPRSPWAAALVCTIIPAMLLIFVRLENNGPSASPTDDSKP